MCKEITLTEIVLIEDLISIVSEQFDNPAIFERCRTDRYTVPRHLVHYLLIKVVGLKYEQVTMITGLKKTAQINSIKFITRELEIYSTFRMIFMQVTTKIISRLSADHVLRMRNVRKNWHNQELYNHYIRSFENFKLPQRITQHSRFYA